MNMRKMREYFPVLTAVSVATFICFLFGIEAVEYIERRLPFDLLPSAVRSSNIMRYFLGLVVLVAVFALGYFLLYTFMPKNPILKYYTKQLDQRTYRKHLFLMVGVASFLLLVRRFVFERNDYGTGYITWNTIPLWLALGMLVIWSVLTLRFAKSGRDVSAVFLWICYLLSVCMGFVSGLVLDIFNGDIHHGIAYIESIYNVYHMIPYTPITTGIYGHHGLFFAPFMHLMDNTSLVLAILIALSQAITVFFTIYCIHNVVKYNWLRILATLASCTTIFAMRPTNYWQLEPHRILFGVILLAYVVNMVKHDRWKRREMVCGYLICTFACLWNAESGLFCSVSFALAVIAHNLQSDVWYSKRMLVRYALHITGIIVSMAGAVLIVNIYNFVCGYRVLLLKDFFFPLFSSEYLNESLKKDIQINLDAWVFVLALFAFLLLLGLYYTTFFNSKNALMKSETAKFAPVIVAVALLGLSNYSYYANRAAYFNLNIIVQFACIGNCLLIQIFSRDFDIQKQNYDYRRMCKSSLQIVCMLVISGLALQTIVFTPSVLMGKQAAGYFSVSEYQKACIQVRDAVPQNTFAFGGGISAIYNDLDWDTGGHYRDFSDLLVGGNQLLEEIASDAAKEDSFVVYHSIGAKQLEAGLDIGNEQRVLDRILELEPDFSLSWEMEIHGIPLQYYCK